MKRVVIAPTLDMKKLIARFASRFGAEDTVCTSKENIESLIQVDEVYFVFSENAALSTQYQALVIDSLPKMKETIGARCFLLRLDETEIPQGFILLKSLPEKTIQ